MDTLREYRELYPEEFRKFTDYEITQAAYQSIGKGQPFETFAKEFGGVTEENPLDVQLAQQNDKFWEASEHLAKARKISVNEAGKLILNKNRDGLFGPELTLLEGIGDAITDQFPEDVARIWRGGDIAPNADTWANRTIEQQKKDRAARIPSLQEARGDYFANALYQGPQSVTTSLATGLAGGAIGGAVGSAVPVVGNVAGSMIGAGTASGIAFYRQAKDSFMDEVLQKAESLRGRPLTSEEARELSTLIDSDATEYGLYEAGPEAISQFFTAGLFKGAGGALLKRLGLGNLSESVAKRAWTRIPAKLGAESAEELGTEAATYMLQGQKEKDFLLRDTDPTLGEFASEQSGPVLVGALLQGGITGGMNRLGRRNQRPSSPPSSPSDAPGSAFNPDATPSFAEENGRQEETAVQAGQPLALPPGRQAPDFAVTPAGQVFSREGSSLPQNESIIPAGPNASGTLALPETTPQTPLQVGLNSILGGAVYPDIVLRQQNQFSIPPAINVPPQDTAPALAGTANLPAIRQPSLPAPAAPVEQDSVTPDTRPVDSISSGMTEGTVPAGPVLGGAVAVSPVQRQETPPPVMKTRRVYRSAGQPPPDTQDTLPQLRLVPVNEKSFRIEGDTGNLGRVLANLGGRKDGTTGWRFPAESEEQVRNVLGNLLEENAKNALQDSSDLSDGMVKSDIPELQKSETDDEYRQRLGRNGRFVGGTQREDKESSLPDGRSKGGNAATVPQGMEWTGGRIPETHGNSEPVRREGSAGTLPAERTDSGAVQTGSAESGEIADGGKNRRKTSIKIPNHAAESATYELMEADDVQASHLPEFSFQKNPRYGLENERRYHDEPASQTKVLNNARTLDPDFLLESVDANHGAPIVDQEGNVLGGNGRTMSIRHAYERFPERAEAYRKAIRKKAAELGIDPDLIEKMRRPMLVRRLDRTMDRESRQQLVTALNDTFTDSKDSRASGKSRGDRFSPQTLKALGNGLKEADTLRQYFDLPESAALVDRLVRDGVIRNTERNAYIGPDGLLNSDGKRVVEEALRGRVAGSYDSLAALPGSIVAKIDAAIPAILRAENVSPQWSVTKHMSDALDLTAEFVKSGIKSPHAFLNQRDMLKSGSTPKERYSQAAQQFFILAQEKSKKDFVELCNKYAAQAESSDAAQGLPGLVPPQSQVAENIFGIRDTPRKHMKEQANADINSNRNLEQDSKRNEPENRMGKTDLPDVRRRDGETGREGSGRAGTEVSASRGERLSGHETPPAGDEGHSDMAEKESRLQKRTAGSEQSGRSRNDGQPGLDVQRNGEETAQGTSDSGHEDSIIPVSDHLLEVQKALPNLYPGQQEDVVFAESRFRSGQGVMFTNGTGTGKTGLGLGIIARLARAGRKNILIAVPADKIGTDWSLLGKKLGVSVSKLMDTTDAGQGICVTTHANMAQNDALFSRDWDLIVIDEAHKLSSSQQGKKTELLDRLRALALHPRGLHTRAAMTGKGPDLIRQLNEFRDKEELTSQEQKEFDELNRQFEEWKKEVSASIEEAKGTNRADLARTDGKKPGVLMLSATPFAYEKSIDYAEGFLFDYPEQDAHGGYNQPDGYEQFMIDHFGYRMRYGKLTQPAAEVDSGLMQREFNSWLKKQGVLSSRNLDTPFDYDRRFILTENAIGQKIDEGLDFLHENRDRYGKILEYINKKFDHLAKRYLLEAIKARESISIIQENLRLGRKIVVFHQFNKGGGFNPFDVSDITPQSGEELYRQARAFRQERPDLVKLPLKDLDSPVVTLKAAFPEARVFSGLVSKKEREEAVRDFQKDEGGANIIIVQADAGEAGLSLHDTTGKHQRVLINLGLPTKPVTAIQQEGRIFRAGQKSNAMFRYLNTGTNWERYAFAQTIAQRASAAENLALGEEARGLKDAFIQAFEDSDTANVGMEGEGTGGKTKDRSLQTATSEFDRAKSLYFGQQKRTSRNKSREGTDYFATPEPLGQKMVEWAAIESGSSVLEPSAGHGAIARWFPENANRTVVEPSSELASKLMLATDAKLRNVPFEQLEAVNKYDSIVMNPPFGKGGKTAMEHLEKAFRHLRPNGRIVAIVPDGPSMQKRLDGFFDYDEKATLVPVLRREILLPEVTFERAGTKIRCKVLIIDSVRSDVLKHENMQPSSRVELTGVKSIHELFDRIENMDAPPRANQDASFINRERSSQITVSSRTVASRQERPLASLARHPVRRPDSTPVRVVDVDPGIVPEFSKARDLAKWLKEYFADRREETILSTGKNVRFGNGNLEASIKRKREKAHNQAYAGLSELVRQAEFDAFAPQDERHPNLGGQEVYYSALRIGDTLYAVKMKFDVPSNEEVAIRRRWRKEKDIEDLRYKDHTLREIEIAPVLYRGVVPVNGVPTQATGAIQEKSIEETGRKVKKTAHVAENHGFADRATGAAKTISLGVLRDAVKPSRLEGGHLSSIAPSQFLSPSRPGKAVRKSAIRSLVEKLVAKAKSAAPTKVVQSFSELPQHIQDNYGDYATQIEGVYDPGTGTVYLVADNLTSPVRAAEVWMHEMLVHHGLRGLFGIKGTSQLLNRLWLQLGGMKNPALADIARRYGLDPRRQTMDRSVVVEEYLASLAEKRAKSSLEKQEQSFWKRFLTAVMKAWQNMVRAVTGNDSANMTTESLEALLDTLEGYVFNGRTQQTNLPGSQIEAPAFASVHSPKENVRYRQVGKRESPHDLVLLPDGSTDFGMMEAHSLNNGKMLKSAPFRLKRGRSFMGGGYGFANIEDVHGDEIRQAGYSGVQEFVWDLVNSFDEIWEGIGGSLTLVRNGSRGKLAGFIELERHGDYYEIKSAFPVRGMYPQQKTRKLLWKRHSSASTATDERNPFLSNNAWLGRASILSEDAPKSQRRQSSEKNLLQASDGDNPLASMNEAMEATGHAAWEQLQRDMEEWARQVDAFDPAPSRGADKRRLLSVCRTPDVLRKLGAPDLPMTMTARNLEKILSDKPDHHLPKDLVKQLPRALAEPVMVFESATSPDSFVVLTELKHEGRSVMAAIHLDTERQNIRVNDIASAYKRGNEAWYIRQIEDGRLLYQDKKKSLAWARTHRLQLPKVRRLPARLSGNRVLTDADIVKPAPPLASIANDQKKSLAWARTKGLQLPRVRKLPARLSENRVLTEKDIVKPVERQDPQADSGIRASLRREQNTSDNPALDSFRSKIGGRRQTLGESFAAFRKNWKRTLEQLIFDHFASIRDISEEGYRQARMTTSLGSQIQSIIEYGAPVWNEGLMDVQGKSLREVFSPVAEEMSRFLEWMVANRASRLKEEGRENLFSEEEIAAALQLNEGQMPDGTDRKATYAQVFRDVAEFKKKVLDFAEQGGIIDPESRKIWEHADYIPFYRVQEGMSGGVTSPGNRNGLAGQSSGIRHLSGGTANIGDPLENIMRNFIHLIDAAQKNKAATLILSDMYKANLAEKLSSEQVNELEKQQGRALVEQLKQDKELASQFGPLSSREKALLSKAFTPGSMQFVRVQYGGKSYYFSVSDPLLFNTLTGIWKEHDRKGPVWKVLRAFRRALTTGVTVMPDFILRNFLRDTLHTWTIEHKSGFTPLKDSLAQIRNAYNVDEDTRRLLAAGSAFMGSGYRLGSSGEEAAKALNRLLEKSGMDATSFRGSILDTPKKMARLFGKLLDRYEHGSSAAENAARLAVYKKMRARGYSHRQAAFAAKDLMDFTLRGESQIVQALCEMVPFLGARLAGLHRLGRGATENPRAFALKGMTIAAASMLLYALNQALHPDDWDELEDWDRDTYYHFWIGDEHFRLPKPFEVGFLFGTIPERMMEQAMTERAGSVFFERVFSGLWEQLSFDPVPQAVKPMLEQFANKNSFTKRPIVGMGLDRKAPVDQYTATTSLTARAIASFMDSLLSPVMGKTGADSLRSPVRIEHMVRGYFGGLGTLVLGLSDTVIGTVSDQPEAPERRFEDYPVVRAVYRGSGPQRTRYESELYDILKRGNKLHASMKQTAEEGGSVQAFRDDLNDDDMLALAARKGLANVTREFTKLNKAAEKIRMSRTMSSSQKRKELDLIQARKNMLAKHTWQRIERMRAQ